MVRLSGPQVFGRNSWVPHLGKIAALTVVDHFVQILPLAAELGDILGKSLASKFLDLRKSLHFARHSAASLHCTLRFFPLSFSFPLFLRYPRQLADFRGT
eukprot:scaffold1231_cov187-Pinguiococcus_pyrenoidosus.AAC.4